MPNLVVVGVGTMGAGIAQVAAAAGWTVRLADVDPAFVARQIDALRRNFDRLVEKGRMSAAQRDAAAGSLHPAAGPADAASADLVIEAVVEDLSAKVAALAPLAAAASAGAIFATNTSSLSVTALAQGLAAAAQSAAAPLAPRFVGMHFFNPVALMPLVEIIAGRQTEPGIADRAAQFAAGWGKTVVRAADKPGFIVNRVARGYYLEALRMLDEGVASVGEIDHTLRTLGGFRMGPFELMDLIGIDVNYSVSCSVWEQLGRPERLRPHAIQARLVEQKHFGRKTKRGFYSYDAEPPVPAVVAERRSFDLPAKVYETVRRVADAGAAGAGSSTEQYVFARTIAAIINEAAHLLDDRGATAADIDTAMKLGTNYPRGPCEWAERIGRNTVAALLRALDEQARDGRFAPAASLL